MVSPHPRILIDPTVCHGKPVVAGTRVLVAAVVGAVASGDAPEAVASAFGISVEDVRACLAYASELVSRERHFPLAS